MIRNLPASSLRVLKLLKHGACRVEPSSIDQKLLLHVQQGAVSVHRDDILRLASSGLLVRKGHKLALSPEGRRQLHANTAASARQNEKIPIQQRIQISCSESPLAALYKRKGANSLTQAEFLAGERLREDFTRAHMMPSVTMRWDVTAVGRNSAACGTPFNISDTALESRNRVNQALKAVGPELGGLLVDICCFLKGIELVERERALPVRSAKVLLKVGLSVLDRHYNPQASGNDVSSGFSHWGTADYRPQILS